VVSKKTLFCKLKGSIGKKSYHKKNISVISTKTYIPGVAMVNAYEDKKTSEAFAYCIDDISDKIIKKFEYR
tara:strand:- start:613 stop:825 length:213 start_codon:yes stop_codon:yes gene_type:complete